MVRIAQIGTILIAIGAIGVLVGLFPGILGLPPTPGIGVIQLLVISNGLLLLILGGLTYARFMFYARQPLTLAQHIGIRLSFTGLVFAVLIAFADILGFGSNLRFENEEPVFGTIQGAGVVISFGIAALGVLIFTLAGQPDLPDELD